MSRPVDAARRSPVYRRLEALGAKFGAHGGGIVAERIPWPSGMRPPLGLADLSPLPRWGIKGTGAVSWLESKSVAMPARVNEARQQEGGALVCRLAAQEALILDPILNAGAGSAGLCAQLADTWIEDRRHGNAGGYPVPRSDTHAWLLLVGDKAPETLAKISAVDLRRHVFATMAIAQTQVARLSAVVVRGDVGGRDAYHLLVDFAAAIYFWDCVIDAIAEFDGAAIGLADVPLVGE